MRFGYNDRSDAQHFFRLNLFLRKHRVISTDKKVCAEASFRKTKHGLTELCQQQNLRDFSRRSRFCQVLFTYLRSICLFLIYLYVIKVDITNEATASVDVEETDIVSRQSACKSSCEHLGCRAYSASNVVVLAYGFNFQLDMESYVLCSSGRRHYCFAGLVYLVSSTHNDITV